MDYSDVLDYALGWSQAVLRSTQTLPWSKLGIGAASGQEFISCRKDSSIRRKLINSIGNRAPRHCLRKVHIDPAAGGSFLDWHFRRDIERFQKDESIRPMNDRCTCRDGIARDIPRVRQRAGLRIVRAEEIVTFENAHPRAEIERSQEFSGQVHRPDREPV